MVCAHLLFLILARRSTALPLSPAPTQMAKGFLMGGEEFLELLFTCPETAVLGAVSLFL